MVKDGDCPGENGLDLLGVSQEAAADRFPSKIDRHHHPRSAAHLRGIKGARG
jgi:hypothetical protein